MSRSISKTSILLFLAILSASCVSVPTPVSLLPPPTPTAPVTLPLSTSQTLGMGSTKLAGDGSLMIFIPAGEFPMGSSEADQNARVDEKPLHSVYLDAFWIGKYEVTNALYKRCVDAGRCIAPSVGSWSSGTFPPGKENYPVVAVTWNDAVAYAQWMGGRLPTEAEWEKAACWDEAKKAKRLFAWGDEFDAKKANTRESGIGDTTPVGTYSPLGDSPSGVSDMTGNVWEWAADWFISDYYLSSPAHNPKGPSSGGVRATRGGAWNLWGRVARCASRYGDFPDLRDGTIGFRVAQSFP